VSRARIHPCLGRWAAPMLNTPVRPGTPHGVDLLVPEGWPVFAAHDGRVLFAGHVLGYGTTIALEDGEWQTRYARLSRALASRYAPIRAGELIGYSGRIRMNDDVPPHLHFDVRLKPAGSPTLDWDDGIPVDPIEWLLGRVGVEVG
jgi:murein DD-endopeptidase MepM/ murein hydrolase activator NlpD